MVKKWIKDIGQILYALRERPPAPRTMTVGQIMDSYELCGWQKCPVQEKIKEDYSI